MNIPAQQRRSHRWAAFLTLGACLFVLSLLTWIQSAAADLSFCPPGSGAGQCSSPEGVATDFETGRVYVADQGNHRVDVFESDGDFLFAFGWGVKTGAAALETCTSCQAGLSGAGAGQLSAPRWIAVDNIPGSASRHDVYVIGGNFRVEHFKEDGSFLGAFGWGVDTGAAKLEACTTGSGCQAGILGEGECQLNGAFQPVSVGSAGNVFVSVTDGSEPNFIDKVQKFSSVGACLDEIVLVKGNHRQTSLAVDSSEDAFVADERGSGLRKYDLGTDETELCDLDPGIGTNALALDEASHLFAFQLEGRAIGVGKFRVITEYGTACPSTKNISRFGYGQIPPSTSSIPGLAAFHSPNGDIFASEGANGIHYLKAPPPGPIIPPESVEADPIGNTKATIKAEINPEGKATSYNVEYLTQEDFEDNNGFSGAKSTPSTPLDIPTGREFRVNIADTVVGCPVATQQLINEGKCLEPETEYRYRVLADNADGEGEGPVEGTFATKKPIEVNSVYATEVGTKEATINADVNPLGIPATGHFEYVDDARFQASGFAEATKVPDVDGEPPQVEIDFGSAEVPTKRSATLFPLQSGTIYHYRLVGENPFLDEPLITEAETFTTFTPQSPTLGACPGNEVLRTGPAGLLPDCRAYEMVSPVDKANGDIVVLGQIGTSQAAVLLQSATSGDRLTYGSYRAFGDAKSGPFTSQYLAVRDPEDGWRSHGISPPQDRSLYGGAYFDFEFRAFSDDLCEGWLVPLSEPPLAEGAEPGNKNLYRRSDQLCGEEDFETISRAKPERLTRLFQLELQGLSADRSVAAFAANDSLEGTGAPAQPPGCKASNRPPCIARLYVRQTGSQPRFACVLPSGKASKDHCMAGTGTIFDLLSHSRTASLTNALSANGKRLFWTASIGDGRIYLRENPLGEGPECVEATSPCTFPVSEEAEEESSSSSHFWAAAKDGSVAIFTSGSGLYEYEVEGKTTQKIAGGVSGVVGTSGDVSHVYFASSEVLTGEEANSNGDKAEVGKPNLYLAVSGPGSGSYRFIGTLNTEDVNPSPNREVSSATAVEPYHRNSRVSTDGLHAAFMSTAPLTGYDNADAASAKADNEVFLYDATANSGSGGLICASCNPSGGRPVGDNFGPDVRSPFWVAARLPVFATSLYAPRVLSGDGSRLFFESQDALVPNDTNGRLDVYQWEEEGSGDCESSKATFAPSAHGCIDLISSGQSKRDSEFVDASPTGEDVFFTTLSSLVLQDYGLVDIYDARVDGGFPPPPAPPLACEGEACQGPPSAPNDSTPASSSFQGAGNVAAKPSVKKKKKRKAHQRKHRRAHHKGRKRR